MYTRILLNAGICLGISSFYHDSQCAQADLSDLKKDLCRLTLADWHSVEGDKIKLRHSKLVKASEAATSKCINPKIANDVDIKAAFEIIREGQQGLSIENMRDDIQLPVKAKWESLASFCFSGLLRYINVRCPAALKQNSKLASDVSGVAEWWKSHSTTALSVEDKTISENAGKIAGILDACPNESSAARAVIKAESGAVPSASEAEKPLERRPELPAVASTPSGAGEIADATKVEPAVEVVEAHVGPSEPRAKDIGGPAAPKGGATVVVGPLQSGLHAPPDHGTEQSAVASTPIIAASGATQAVPHEQSRKTPNVVDETSHQLEQQAPPVKSAAPKSNNLLLPAALGGIAAVMLSGSRKRSSIGGTLARAAAGAGLGAAAYHWLWGPSRQSSGSRT